MKYIIDLTKVLCNAVYAFHHGICNSIHEPKWYDVAWKGKNMMSWSFHQRDDDMKPSWYALISTCRLCYLLEWIFATIHATCRSFQYWNYCSMLIYKRQTRHIIWSYSSWGMIPSFMQNNYEHEMKCSSDE